MLNPAIELIFSITLYKLPTQLKDKYEDWSPHFHGSVSFVCYYVLGFRLSTGKDEVYVDNKFQNIQSDTTSFMYLDLLCLTVLNVRGLISFVYNYLCMKFMYAYT